MNIELTKNNFIVAMETYGSKRLPDRPGLRYPNLLAPSFEIAGVVFLHSGSIYTVSKYEEDISDNYVAPLHYEDIPDEIILYEAMEKFGETFPGGDNFWYGAIYTIPALFTFVSMLEGKYSQEFVDQLTNETYKKLHEKA